MQRFRKFTLCLTFCAKIIHSHSPLGNFKVNCGCNTVVLFKERFFRTANLRRRFTEVFYKYIVVHYYFIYTQRIFLWFAMRKIMCQSLIIKNTGNIVCLLKCYKKNQVVLTWFESFRWICLLSHISTNRLMFNSQANFRIDSN